MGERGESSKEVSLIIPQTFSFSSLNRNSIFRESLNPRILTSSSVIGAPLYEFSCDHGECYSQLGIRSCHACNRGNRKAVRKHAGGTLDICKAFPGSEVGRVSKRFARKILGAVVLATSDDFRVRVLRKETAKDHRSPMSTELTESAAIYLIRATLLGTQAQIGLSSDISADLFVVPVVR